MANTASTSDAVEKSAQLLTAMANPKRLMILNLLVNDEISVGVLAEMVRLSQSALSQHLSKLRAAKIVVSAGMRRHSITRATPLRFDMFCKPLFQLYGNAHPAENENLTAPRSANSGAGYKAVSRVWAGLSWRLPTLAKLPNGTACLNPVGSFFAGS